MTIGKKSIAVILACALAFIALALCAPLFIDRDVLRNKISRELSGMLHADVRIEQLGLSLFFRPHLSLRGVTCSVQNSYSLAIQDAYIYPSFQALLAGKLEPGLISLQAPDLQFQLPRQPASDKPDASPEEKQKKTAAFIEAVIQNLPACPFEISDGTAGIAGPDGTRLVVDSLNAEMAPLAGGLSLSVSCASRLWKKLSLAAQYRSPAASGGEAAGDGSPALSLELEARAIDIPASRDMLLAFAGTNLLVSSICEKIYSGKIKTVSFTAKLPRV
ncbi:MAG: hypothetical protein NTX06_04175, partial [Proteobacteria bacterium]|nr:hypothetical protein [Pseudomonadota bacterium]